MYLSYVSCITVPFSVLQINQQSNMSLQWTVNLVIYVFMGCNCISALEIAEMNEQTEMVNYIKGQSCYLHSEVILNPSITLSMIKRCLCCLMIMSLPNKVTMHQVATMLATSKTVQFPGQNHLLTTSTDDPSL